MYLLVFLLLLLSLMFRKSLDTSSETCQSERICKKLPNQIGYLVLKDDGAVLESGGDLENDERSANILIGLLQLTESVDENFMPNSSCERISITYEDHSYNICMSNRKIYILKLRNSARNGVSNGNYVADGIDNVVTA